MADDADARPLQRRAYRFFGRVVAVHTDTRAVADVLDGVYERQRILEPTPDEVDVLVEVRSATPAGAVIGVGARRVRVIDWPETVSMADK